MAVFIGLNQHCRPQPAPQYIQKDSRFAGISRSPGSSILAATDGKQLSSFSTITHRVK